MATPGATEGPGRAEGHGKACWTPPGRDLRPEPMTRPLRPSRRPEPTCDRAIPGQPRPVGGHHRPAGPVSTQHPGRRSAASRRNGSTSCTARGPVTRAAAHRRGRTTNGSTAPRQMRGRPGPDCGRNASTAHSKLQPVRTPGRTCRCGSRRGEPHHRRRTGGLRRREQGVRPEPWWGS